MIANEKCFERPEPFTAFYLESRGFNQRGNRDGGIIKPLEVVLPAGHCLFRFYGGNKVKPDGQWWFTPFELSLLMHNMGHQDFNLGHADGTGILHKAGVVNRFGWGSPMSKFRVIRLKSELKAFYGEGDGYLDASGTYVKGLRVVGSRDGQRYVNQVFIPRFRDYAKYVVEEDSITEKELAESIAKWPAHPLGFES